MKVRVMGRMKGRVKGRVGSRPREVVWQEACLFRNNTYFSEKKQIDMERRWLR